MKHWVLAAFILSFPALAQNPAVSNGGVVNAASFAQGQAVTPGSLVSIFGTNLAAGLAQADTIPLSNSLGGVSVTFNGIAAPLLFVAPGQINAQLPWNMTAGNATVAVNTNGATAQTSFPVAAASPGIFSVQFGVGQAIAINLDGTLAAPAGSIAGLTTHPAKRGDPLIIYANGLGAVNPTVASGQNSLDQLRNTVITPVVLVGGAQAQVLFSGLTPQFVGVNQVNIVIPPGAPAGDKVPLQFQMGGITTTDQVTVALQ